MSSWINQHAGEPGQSRNSRSSQDSQPGQGSQDSRRTGENYRQYYEETDPAVRARLVAQQGSPQMQQLFAIRHPRRRKPESEDVYLQVYFDLMRISKDSTGTAHPGARLARTGSRTNINRMKTILERLGFSIRPAGSSLPPDENDPDPETKPQNALSGPDFSRHQHQHQDQDTLLYWELRNALRRFLEVTDTDAYGRRFMGMVRLGREEQLQHACIEVWHILHGIDILASGLRLEELTQPAALIRQAITDEYTAHDDGAAARLHHVSLTMEART